MSSFHATPHYISSFDQKTETNPIPIPFLSPFPFPLSQKKASRSNLVCPKPMINPQHMHMEKLHRRDGRHEGGRTAHEIFSSLSLSLCIATSQLLHSFVYMANCARVEVCPVPFFCCCCVCVWVWFRMFLVLLLLLASSRWWNELERLFVGHMCERRREWIGWLREERRREEKVGMVPEWSERCRVAFVRSFPFLV